MWPQAVLDLSGGSMRRQAGIPVDPGIVESENSLCGFPDESLIIREGSLGFQDSCVLSCETNHSQTHNGTAKQKPKLRRGTSNTEANGGQKSKDEKGMTCIHQTQSIKQLVSPVST